MKKNTKSDNPGFDASVMLLSEKSSFSMQEAYKTLRTNVTFSLPDSDCKCIGVVSANRGEGKSSIACNLSISLAQLGYKIILIDCDMRLPTVASKLGIKSVPGLSNYLSGFCSEMPIVHIENRGIDVIPSGNIPPDSTTLLNSNQMKKMIEKLKKEYDYILLDFPPVNVVSDAVMMSGQVDGYLLIIKHNSSQYQLVAETIRQFRFTDAKIIGIVYNGKSEEKKYYKNGKYGKSKYYKYAYYKKD